MNLPISIWTNYFNEFSPEQKVKTIKSCDFDYAELSTEEGATPIKIAKLKYAKKIAEYLLGLY